MAVLRPLGEFVVVTLFLVACSSGSSGSSGAADGSSGSSGSSGGPGTTSGGPNGGSSGASGGTSGSSGSTSTKPALAVSAASHLGVPLGGSALVHVSVIRTGWTGSVTLTLKNLGAGLSSAPVVIPAGAADTDLVVTATTTASTTDSPATIEANGDGLTAKASIAIRAAHDEVDSTFGTGGIISSMSGFPDMAVQPDGKIVLAVGSPIAVRRLLPSGAPDTTFGAGGVASIAVSSYVAKVALQADGKIIVALRPSANSGTFAMTRLLASGAVDSSFGTGGVVTESMPGYDTVDTSDVVVQTDGKIVVTATAHMTVAPSPGTTALVARYTSAGQADASFGSNGKSLLSWAAGGYDTATAALVSGSDLYVEGCHYASGYWRLTVAKVTDAGGLDASYGTAGAYLDPGNLYSRLEGDLLKLPTGLMFHAAGGVDLLIGALGASGARDTSFGSSGYLQISDNFVDGYLTDAAGVARDAAGRILVSRGSISKKALVVQAFDATGKPDLAFGGNGLLHFPVLGGIPDGVQLLPTPDGRFVATATSTAGTMLGAFFP